MKKSIMFLLLFTNIIFSQRKGGFHVLDELIVHIWNISNNSLTVTVNAELVENRGGCWYSQRFPNPWTLVPNNVTSFNQISDTKTGTNNTSYYFDTEGDGDNELGLSIYKITISAPGKTKSFYYNTIYCAVPPDYNWNDIHVTYLFDSNTIYSGEYNLSQITPLTPQIESTDIIKAFPTERTLELENYWQNALFSTYEDDFPPHLIYGIYSDDQNRTANRYDIYRAYDLTGSPPSENQYVKFASTTSTVFDFIDNAEICGETTSEFPIYYKVKAFDSSNNFLGTTNTINFLARTDWDKALSILVENNHPKLVWAYAANFTSQSVSKVYMAESNSSIPPDLNQFTEISQPLCMDLCYLDIARNYDPNSFYYAHYYIKPANAGNINDLVTNIVSVKIYHAQEELEPPIINVQRATNNHPMLSWNYINDATYYNIFKSLVRDALNDINLIPFDETTNSNYIDYEETMTLPGQQAGHNVWYRVSAVNQQSESERSNFVSINAPGFNPLKQGTEEELNTEGMDNLTILSQNYPNPFNTSTIISFNLSVRSFVTLRVFDVLGKEIANIISSYKEEGLHKVEFNAGNILPSGIYIYVLTTGEYKEVKKMILMR